MASRVLSSCANVFRGAASSASETSASSNATAMTYALQRLAKCMHHCHYTPGGSPTWSCGHHAWTFIGSTTGSEPPQTIDEALRRIQALNPDSPELARDPRLSCLKICVPGKVKEELAPKK